MKSIKEQADYLYQGYGTNANRKVLRENFIQGANYVLDAIEEFMKHNLVCSSNLKRLIEQLKK